MREMTAFKLETPFSYAVRLIARKNNVEQRWFHDFECDIKTVWRWINRNFISKNMLLSWKF